MPPAQPDQALELKRRARHRLIGAIALVGILVWLLPKALDHEPKPMGETIRIAVENTQPAAQPVAQVNDAQPASTEAATAARAEPAAAATEESVKFVIQVGAFADAKKAKQVEDKLAAASLPVYTESIEQSGGVRIRVRAGPFTQRAQADEALGKLQAIGLDGRVLVQ